MLPNDLARCRGDQADECAACARRIAAQSEAGKAWPIWRVWMVPPITRPCAARIEAAQEAA